MISATIGSNGFFVGTWQNICNLPTAFRNRSQVLARKIVVICSQTFTTVTEIIPNVIKWGCRRVTGQIKAFKLSETSTKIGRVVGNATLFQHGAVKPKDEITSATIFLHGDMSHPTTELDLIDIACTEKRDPVFSLKLSYDDDRPEIYRALFHKAIEQLNVLSGGRITSVTVVGHSKGAIISAFDAFVNKNPILTKIISIAGRLAPSEGASKEIMPILEATQKAILEATDFKKPELFQIYGTKDNNAPASAMAIRQGEAYCFPISGARHLNVLYFNETYRAFRHCYKA